MCKDLLLGWRLPKLDVEGSSPFARSCCKSSRNRGLDCLPVVGGAACFLEPKTVDTVLAFLEGGCTWRKTHAKSCISNSCRDGGVFRGGPYLVSRFLGAVASWPSNSSTGET